MFKYKKHIAFLCLIFFIGIKISGLHALTHHDDENYDDCDTCEYVIISNITPFLISGDSILFEPLTQHCYNEQLFFDYTYFYTKTHTDKSLFGRPPPII